MVVHNNYYFITDIFKNHSPFLVSPMKWFVGLDAASYVASNKLDLSKNKPDFIAISFYKMFGWPTGMSNVFAIIELLIIVF